MFIQAITRKPAPNFSQGITTAGRDVPDYALMLAQHAAYETALQAAGLTVITLAPLADFPDAYFVEDVAVVTPHVAVITRPGAAARRGEETAIRPVLARYRPVEQIEPPGTLDGGDVLMVGDHFFIGLSERTNEAGADQLARILANYGHTSTAVPVAAGLHFKSSVNLVGDRTLLVTEALAGRPELADFEQIKVAADEPDAANILLVNGLLLIPAGHPKTKQKLANWGADISELNVSEASKMDGGLTCMSLRF